MESTYKSWSCTGCGSTQFTYHRHKKVWECIYCGNEIHHEESYDGLYTIKNVVKQVLLDLAKQHMDSAQKNLSECEKIASNYVGTIIAGICYRVFLLFDPDGISQGEISHIIAEMKHCYYELKKIDSGISADEEALYEFLEGSGDCYGVLLLTFDWIKEDVHLDFVKKMMDLSTVYSRSVNKRLLDYAVDNNDTEMIESIFHNHNNLECRSAVAILLNNYADSDKKPVYIRSMMNKAVFKADDHRLFEEYLEKTKDSLETKITLYECAQKAGHIPSLNVVNQSILQDPDINEVQIKRTYAVFCSSHPKDAELYELIDDIYCHHSGAIANKEMEFLMGQDLFIKLNYKVVHAMIGRTEWTLDERISMLEKSEKCNLNAHTNNDLMNDVLLRINERGENRLLLIQEMKKYVDSISTRSVKEYLLNSTRDGDYKLTILRELMGLRMNINSFREDISQYLQNSGDPVNMKKDIVRLFIDNGLAPDDSLVLRFACEADNSNMEEILRLIQKSIDNGCRINDSLLSQYIETVSIDQLNSSVISALSISGSRISDMALAKYVLLTNDIPEIKLQNTVIFAEKNSRPFGSSGCMIRYLNDVIECNLFQAYVLMTRDSEELAGIITGLMKKENVKLNPIIRVNELPMKFKKYIVTRRSQLSQITIALCEENGVFKTFF